MPTENEEPNLITASQKGDARAFNCLVNLHERRVYNLAYRTLGDADAAADATQDTFLSAFRHIRQYRGGSFAGWLLRIATNTCYDEFRRRQRTLQTASLDQAAERDDLRPDPPDPGPTPEDAAIKADLQQHLQRGLATLPYDQRVAVVLSDVQGMSYEEIAEITGTSLGTVKSRLSRGRSHMRNFLLQAGELSEARGRHV